MFMFKDLIFFARLLLFSIYPCLVLVLYFLGSILEAKRFFLLWVYYYVDARLFVQWFDIFFLAGSKRLSNREKIYQLLQVLF